MAEIGDTRLTLMDHAKRLDPNGKIDKIAEMLNQTNEVLDDMVVIEGNLQTGHKATIRTGLPTTAWRQINRGVTPTKSQTAQISFSAGIMENHGQVDELLVELAADKQAFRLSENAPQLESISQTLATTLFYGNVDTNPERFCGLSYYYSSTTAASGANIIKAGGISTDNTSLWLVVWGENTIHGFYPKNTKAGIEHNDLGLQLIEDGVTSGAKLRAWIDQYRCRFGLAVRDWRYAVRICNLDISDLATAGATSDTSANLFVYAAQAVNKIPSLKAGRAAWYCNNYVKTALDIKALNKANVMLSTRELKDGTFMTSLLGIPVRKCDSLTITETAVS